MLHITLFAVYLLISLILFSIIILVFVRMREAHIVENRALTYTTRVFVGILFVIAVFGGYKILTGEILPKRGTSPDIIINL